MIQTAVIGLSAKALLAFIRTLANSRDEAAVRRAVLKFLNIEINTLNQLIDGLIDALPYLEDDEKMFLLRTIETKFNVILSRGRL